MLSELLKTNKKYRIFSFEVLIFVILGFLSTLNNDSLSSVAFLSAIIFIGISWLVIIWIIWTLVLILSMQREQSVRAHQLSGTEPSLEMLLVHQKTTMRRLKVYTILWLSIIVGLFIHLHHVGTIDQSFDSAKTNSLAIVILSWPIFLSFMYMKWSSNIKKANYSECDRILLKTEKYAPYVSLGAPFLLFAMDLVLAMTSLFFLLYLKLS